MLRTTARVLIMLLVTLLITSLTCGLMSGEAILDVDTFSRRLEEFAKDALGTDKIQELFDSKAQVSTEPVTAEKGKQLADELGIKLSARFADRFTALEQITSAAEEAYAGNKFPQSSSYDDSYPQCCDLRSENLEYDPKFLTGTDPGTVCYTVSPTSPRRYTVAATEDMVKGFRQNQRDTPSLTWEYLGTEEGILVNFPAVSYDGCDGYDPRFRPWYVAASSPVPKDLVLVIDSSGSMASRMDVAKVAANTVVGTLNPNDRVGIIRFSTEATTPPGSTVLSRCYNWEMAYAIPDNVDYLTSYIDKINAGGGTAYLAAITAAFKLMRSAQDNPGETRDKVILFLTDGVPTDSNHATILATIRDLNAAMSNSVTIMTYGLLIDNRDAEKLLAAMALQEDADSSFGDINVGVYTSIQSVDNLRQALGSYYSHFSRKTALEKAAITVPYIDAFGLGLISSICDTLLYDGELKGVACVDVRIADMLGDIEFSQPGDDSYTFIIDKTGRTLVHPLLPSPFTVTDDPKFIDISVLEREPAAQEVIQSMKSGESGEKSFVSTFTVGTSNSKQHGVSVKRMLATYIWRKIDDTDLAFCMVFAASDEEVTFVVPGNTQDFLFHRFDLTEPQNTCNHAGRLSTSAQSSVAFSDDAYVDSLRKGRASLTAEEVERMSIYMEASDFNYDTLKDGVKDTVVLTEHMDEFWESHNNKYGPYVSSRHVGTDNGVLRMYPGIALPINYRHKERGWYNDAMANRDKLVMSVPYHDAYGAGIVTSLMHTVLQGKQVHSSSDSVIGVIAADFDIAYIHNMLVDAYPECKSDDYVCFLMDGSGYLIVHPAVADETHKDDNRHIIKHEPAVARELIARKFMVRDSCVSVGTIKQRFMWRISRTSSIDKKNSFLKFEVHWVANSNLYLGIKDKTSRSGAGPCNCPETSSADMKCQRTDSMYCECPCFIAANYDYCSNSYEEESLPAKSCTPLKEQKQFSSPVENGAQKAQKLPLCFDIECAGIENEWECSSLASCSWCPTHKGGKKYQCNTNTQCSTVASGGADDLGVSVNGSASQVPATTIGIAVAVPCAILLIVAGVGLCWYHKRRKRTDVPQTTDTAPTPGERSISALDSPAGHTNPAFDSANHSHPAYGAATAGPSRGNAGASDPHRQPYNEPVAAEPVVNDHQPPPYSLYPSAPSLELY